MSIEAYDYGEKDGIAEERKRIVDWVMSRRTELPLLDGHSIFRDHFTSESLLKFIESGVEQEEDEE